MDSHIYIIYIYISLHTYVHAYISLHAYVQIDIHIQTILFMCRVCNFILLLLCLSALSCVLIVLCGTICRCGSFQPIACTTFLAYGSGWLRRCRTSRPLSPTFWKHTPQRSTRPTSCHVLTS